MNYVLINRLEDPDDGEVILEFDSDGLARERFEEGEDKLPP